MAALAFGCGDTVRRNNADTKAYNEKIVKQDSSFNFSGKAAYCITHSEENPIASTCVKVDVDVQITADEIISKAWNVMYRDSRRGMESQALNGNGTNNLIYRWNTELCIPGHLTGIELFAEDVKGAKASKVLEEVDCGTLDKIIEGQ